MKKPQFLKKETHGYDENKFVTKREWDFQPVVDSVTELRELKRDPASNYMHVGRIPLPLLSLWLKESGVAWSDTEAVQEVIKGKMLSDEFSKLRVNEGTY